MTAATLFILAFSFISLALVRSVPVNKGKGRATEIAFGSVVDYSFAKSSYPFMARIILDGSKCGGALISDRFVATARHCLEFCPCFNEANPSNDWTRCNKLCFLKLRENSDFISDTETVHIIKTIHLPENSGKPYETRGQRTDFALIELAESANICTQEETAQGRCWPVTPVRLPDPSFHIKEGQRVRTLGWGATEFSFGDEQSEFLAQLDITINSSTLFHFLIETNIGPNGADPCKGDSGGPLLLRGDDLEWTLVGTLVGGGYACENPEGKDLTSDWSKTALHVPWITSVMGTTTVDKPVTSVTSMDEPGKLNTNYPCDQVYNSGFDFPKGKSCSQLAGHMEGGSRLVGFLGGGYFEPKACRAKCNANPKCELWRTEQTEKRDTPWCWNHGNLGRNGWCHDARFRNAVEPGNFSGLSGC